MNYDMHINIPLPMFIDMIWCYNWTLYFCLLPMFGATTGNFESSKFLKSWSPSHENDMYNIIT